MNSWQQIQAEQEAMRSYTALLEQARLCQQLYERAGMTLPDRIQRLLGVMPINGDARATTISAHIPALGYTPPPGEKATDWISIAIRDAQATAALLAVLRSTGKPVRAGDVTTKVASLLPNVNYGTVANAGTRLSEDGIIERMDDGWKLLKPEEAGVIHDGRLWGLPTIFGKQEIAAHRREAILHILKHFPTGLQTVQLVEQLQSCSWVHAPVNKDLLKADMQILLEDRKVRRVGNTRKFALAQGEKVE
jgi:hypothetical protein